MTASNQDRYRASPTSTYDQPPPARVQPPEEPTPRARRGERPIWDAVERAITKISRDRNSPWYQWEQRLQSEGLGPICEHCGGTGIVNRQAPKSGGGARYDKEGKLIMPAGLDAQPQPPKNAYGWNSSGQPEAMGSNYYACVNRLVYGVNEVPCPRCRPNEKAPEKAAEAPKKRKGRDSVEKRNRELLSVLNLDPEDAA